jgi:hypothetical protein
VCDAGGDAVEWIQRLIQDERIDVVYSLLNSWDGSNRITADRLRRGCRVPVVRHYKEHLLTPTDDEQTCIERSGGVFVEPWSMYDAGLLHAPAPDDRFRPLNFPNRYTAYLAAGVPVALARDEMCALQSHLRPFHACVIYDEPTDLVRRLPDSEAADGARRAGAAVTFEALFPSLICFIASCRSSCESRPA